MPTPVKTLRSLLNRFRETLFRLLFRARFRYDVFISYSHLDTKAYAVNLKEQLRNLDFTCFLDEEESPVGSALDPTLEKALRKSAALVLLATERALTRPYIASEFEKFMATKRTIVPINISQALSLNNEEALTRHPWSIIKSLNLVWIDENPEAFARQTPSPAIADGIDKLFKYTRRNSRVRTEIIGTAALALLLALGAGYLIQDKAKEVLKQSIRAEAARKDADEKQAIATQARRDAETQLENARQAKSQADEQTKIAEKAKADAAQQQKNAEKAAAEASRQRQLASAAKLDAQKQQTIATARQLANQADLARGQSSSTLSTSTSLAIRSLELHPTLEGDMALRNNLGLLPLQTDEQPYPGKLTVAAVSPNATAVAFLTSNSELEIRRPDKDVVHKGRPARHEFIALSNDGTYVATAGGNTVAIQNIDDARQSWDIKILQASKINAIALSRTGKYLAIIASADEGLWVEVYDKETRKLIGKPIHGDQQDRPLVSVAFSSDKEELIAVGGREMKGGGGNGFLNTWLIQEERCSRNECLKEGCKAEPKYIFVPRSTLRSPNHVEIIALTSGDDYLLTATGQDALVWKRTRLGDYREIARMPLEHPLALAFDKGAAHVHIVSQPPGWKEGAPVETDKTIQVWETAGQWESARTRLASEILAVSFLPDRHLVTTISSTLESEKNGLRVWDAKDVKEKEQEEIHLDLKDRFDFSGDGRYLAFADEQGAVHIRDLVNKTNFGGLTTSRLKSIETIELSYDGKFMVLAGTGSDNGPLLVVYQQLEKIYHESSPALRLPPGTPTDVLGLSRDGNLVATATPRVYEVKIWEVKSGRDVTPKPLVQGSEVRAILFSPRGGLVAAVSGPGHTMVWEAATGRTVASLSGSTWANNSNATHNIAFSDDARYIAIGNSDGTAKVFETLTGQEVMILEHIDPVTSVSFSSDGKYLATATKALDTDSAKQESYMLQTWLVQPRDLIAEACRRSPRACEEQTKRTAEPRPK